MLILASWCVFYYPALDLKDPLLEHYTNIIVSELSTEEKEDIVNLPEEHLIDLHFGLGLYIRNKWLWNNAAPELIAYMKSHGITHEDNMSGVISYLVWTKLYEDLTPEDQKKVNKTRKNKTLKYQIMRRDLDKYLGPVPKKNGQKENNK